MKLTMPLLALFVAGLLVLSQTLYTVDQTRYAIKFQLGEIIETQQRGRACTSRSRSCRTSAISSAAT